MAAKPRTTKDEKEISIVEINEGSLTFYVIGTTPLIFNKMSEKAKRTLLLPGRPMTDAEKAANLKHNPEKEYRDSVYRNYGDGRATRLALPKECFKGAMSTAALDMPGTRKTEIGRLVKIAGTHIDLYGVPELLMSVVRSADINKTPDIRTRAIVRRWACQVTVNYVRPKLNDKGVISLFAASGILSGVGDFRQEKGKGDYGLFRIVDQNDPAFRKIVAEGGRAAQDEALLNYRCYDDETRELLDWYKTEILRLGKGATSRPATVVAAPIEDEEEVAPRPARASKKLVAAAVASKGRQAKPNGRGRRA